MDFLYNALGTVNLLIAASGLLLLAAWLITYNTLLFRLQRRHPRYYKNRGSPYTWFIATDFSLRNGGLRWRRTKAWWLYLARLNQQGPRILPADSSCLRPAKFARASFRSFMVFMILVVICALPANALLLSGSATKHARGEAVSVANLPDPERVSQGDGSSVSISTEPVTGNTYKTTRTTTQTTTLVEDSAPANSSAGSNARQTPASANPQQGTVSRSDLNTILAAVGAPGQKRVEKRFDCANLHSQQPFATDVAPSNVDPCSDGNLQTYSAY